MTHQITLVPGFGSSVSPVVAAVQRVLEAMKIDIAWDKQSVVGSENIERLVESAKKTGAVLMPYMPVDRVAGERTPIVELRRAIHGFANIRPVHSLAGVEQRHPDVDVVVVRETTEDVYANLEHETVADVYESIKVTTRAACERIANYAFMYARENGRKKVTIVHKSNIMKKSDGLFLRTAREVAAKYPDIETEDVIVDALCMKLVLYPSTFDVLLCGNLFGDIVADLAAGLVGGAANAPSMNVGDDNVVVFTAGVGDDASVACTQHATPTSLFFSAVLLLRHVGETEAADRLMRAIDATLEKNVLPYSLGGETTVDGFADHVISSLS